jgi:hypothetical protein
LRYGKPANSRRAAKYPLAWLAVLFLFAFALAAQPKAIRLREETILTPSESKTAAAPSFPSTLSTLRRVAGKCRMQKFAPPVLKSSQSPPAACL